MKHQIFKIHFPLIIKHVITMLIVMIGWVLFRADTLSYAVGYIGRMFGLGEMSTIYFQTGYYVDAYRIFIIFVAIFASYGLFRWGNSNLKKCRNYIVIRNIVTIMLMLICAVYVMIATYNPFIYFRF